MSTEPGQTQLRDFFGAPDPSSLDKAKPHALDRPIPLEWLGAIDAQLDLDVRSVADSLVPIRDAATTGTLSDGRLALSPLRATLGGIPVRGDLTIVPSEDGAEFGLAAEADTLDLGDVVELLEPGGHVQGNLEDLTLAVSSRGRTLREVLRGADLNLRTQRGRIISGDDEAETRWTFDITGAEIAANRAQPTRINVDGKYRAVPLALAAETMTLEALASGTESWPLSLEARIADAILSVDGAIMRTVDGPALELQAAVEGDRLAALSPLLGVTLPDTRPYQLSAALIRARNSYTASGLNGYVGSTDIAGELQLTRVSGRSRLTGRLVSQSMRVQDLFAAPEPRSDGKAAAGVLDRPLPLDWLAAIDAELKLVVRRIRGSPVSISSATATVRLEQGGLTVRPLRATVAGNPVTGNLSIALGDPTPEVRLAAEAIRLDLGSLLEQLESDMPIMGGADDMTLAVTGRGRSIRALLRDADFLLEMRRGRITSRGDKAEKRWRLDIAAAAIEAKKAQPMKLTVNGNYRAKPFQLIMDIVTLEGLVADTRPWPLVASLQVAEVSLSASGSVTHPFRGSGFDLEFEVAGADVSELDPILGYVIPLRGEYRVVGHLSEDARRFSLSDLEVRVGQSDIGGSVVFVMAEPRTRISARLRSQTVHYDDLEFVESVDEHHDRTRVVPEYVLPVEALQTVDLHVDLRAGRIRIGRGEFGDLEVKATVENGASVLSVRVRNERSGSRLSFKHEGNVVIDPPLNSVHITARDLDYGLILTDAEAVDFAEGRADVDIELTGPGATQRSFLAQAEGHITVTGGSGRIASHAYGLWSSDLVMTMLSRGWRREPMMEINCIAGEVDVEGGVARTDRLLVDTSRLTIAASGTLDLDTEVLDLLLSPRPKQAQLLSAATPVRVTGTLAKPEVAATILPGPQDGIVLVAGLVNPALLVFAFSDIGADGGNSCKAAVENRDAAAID